MNHVTSRKSGGGGGVPRVPREFPWETPRVFRDTVVELPATPNCVGLETYSEISCALKTQQDFTFAEQSRSFLPDRCLGSINFKV